MSQSATTGVAGVSHSPTRGRWWIVIAALLLQFSIGAVYAWSVFSSALKKPDAMGLSNPEASLPFTVTIGMIFIGAYIGGRIQDRKGPRPVALVGGIIYAIGCILASFAQSHDQLWLLVLGYGVISGCGFGLGFAYIVPIAMYPANPDWAFLPLGIGYLVLSLAGASFFRNPPAGEAAQAARRVRSPRQRRCAQDSAPFVQG